jgi:hypothetical protein
MSCNKIHIRPEDRENGILPRTAVEVVGDYFRDCCRCLLVLFSRMGVRVRTGIGRIEHDTA